jgi:hypothetical protein
LPRRAPAPRSLVALAAISALAVLAAGCGSSGSSSSGKVGTLATDTSGAPNGGGGVNGISVANCLNDANFLTSPSQTTIDGTSPAGVSFSMTFYPTPAAAVAAAAKKNKKTTLVVENSVVDFKGNISPYAGAPPAKISKVEAAAIKTCIDKNKK